MSEMLRIIALAVLQGITEYLPISSSGHLVLAEHWLEMKSSGIVLEVTLHAGTLLSVLVFYRKRIMELLGQFFSGEGEGRRYAAAVVAGSIPAGVGYALLSDRIESFFSDPRYVAMFICVTGLLLLTLLRKPRVQTELNAVRGFLIGLAQAVALLPGISRSGSTIVAARHLGISPEKAAEFSLLLSVPAIIGAIAVQAMHVWKTGLGGLSATNLGIGMVVAAVVGYISIVCLVKLLSVGKLWLFGIYCIVVGLVAVVLL